MTETATSPISDGTLAQLDRFFSACGQWLRQNLKSALWAGVISFAIGWLINFCLMAFVYDGWRMDYSGESEQLATGEFNLVNGMLIWSLFSSVAFGLGFYWYSVGTQKFLSDLAGFPEAVSELFRRDGKSVWIHMAWGAAASLLATYFVSRWVGLAVATVIVAAALSPIGIILASMAAQLWRAGMRDLGPARQARPAGLAGVMVATFTTSLVLAASFFFVDPTLKLGLGVAAAAGAIYLSHQRARQLAPLIALLVPAGLALFAPELAWADDGGFAEAGNDLGYWMESAGFEGLIGYALYGGFAASVGGVAGAVVGGASGGMPPPPGGWYDALDPDGDGGEGDPSAEGAGPDGEMAGEELAPDGSAEGDPAEAESAETEAEADPALEGEAEDAPDGEAVPEEAVDEEAAPDEQPAEDDAGPPQDPETPFDPDNAASVIRAANAGNPDAIERLKELKGENDPSVLQELLSLSTRAALGPVGSMIYDEIGGAETIKELLKLDWVKEVSDTAGALGGAAVEYGADLVEGVANLGSFLWGKAKETVEGAAELATMDSDELVGMAEQVRDDIANSVVGRTISETIDGIKDLATMDRREWLGLADQIYQDGAQMHREAVDALADRIMQGQQLVEGMTAEEALAHLGRAMGEADRYVDRLKQEAWRQDPNAVREGLAKATIAVAGEVVTEVTGAGVMKYGGKLVGALTHADEAADAVRAIDKADDALDGTRAVNTADGAVDASRADGVVARRAEDGAAEAADSATSAGTPAGRRTADGAEELGDEAASTGDSAPESPPAARSDAAERAADAPGGAPDAPRDAPESADPGLARASGGDPPAGGGARRTPAEEPDPDMEDWRGRAPESPPAEPPAARGGDVDPDASRRLDRPDLPPEPNRIDESLDAMRDEDLAAAPAARARPEPPPTRRLDEPDIPPEGPARDGPATRRLDEPDMPPDGPGDPTPDRPAQRYSREELDRRLAGDEADPDMDDWRGRPPDTPAAAPSAPRTGDLDPNATRRLDRPDLPPEPNRVGEAMDDIRDHDLGDVPPARPGSPDPDMDDWRGRPPEAPPSAPSAPRTGDLDPNATRRLDRPDLPPEPNRVGEAMDDIRDHDLGDVPPARPGSPDPDMDDWRGRPPEAPAAAPSAPRTGDLDPNATRRLDRPDLPPEPNRVGEAMDDIRDHDMGDVPPARPGSPDPDMDDWRGRPPEAPAAAPSAPRTGDLDPNATRRLDRPDLPPEPNRVGEAMDDIRDHDLGDVPPARPGSPNPDMDDWRGRPPDTPAAAPSAPRTGDLDPNATRRLDRPDLPPEPNRVGEAMDDIRDHDLGDVPPGRRTPVDRDAPTERFNEPDASSPDRPSDYGRDYDGPAPDDIPRSRDGRPGTMEEGWKERETDPFGKYDDDPLIDPVTGEKLPDPTPKPPPDWDPEGSMPRVTDDGLRSLPEGAHNPLDEAYASMRGAERQLDTAAGAADPADAARRAHDQYERALRRAEDALGDPAMRERLDPHVLKELEDSVRPENRRTLDDFRRRAGLDEPPGEPRAPRRPDDFDPEGTTREMDRPRGDDFDPDGVTREMDRPRGDDFDPDGVTREMDRPGGADFDPEKVHTLDRPDLPPRRPLDGAADGLDETLPPPGSADAPSSRGSAGDDFDADGVTRDQDSPGRPLDPEGETVSGMPERPRGRSFDEAETVDPGPDAVRDMADADAARARRPAVSEPEPPRGPPRDHPMMADDLNAMPAAHGEGLANRQITARTVVGHDADGLPIPHAHDEVTIDIGGKLSNGSFNDVYFNRQSYFNEELGEGAKDTLVRVSKPIPEAPVMRPGMNPEDFARDQRRYQAQLQSLRGDKIGRDALAEVAGASDDVVAPQVLGRFEVLDEVRDEAGNVVGRSRRVAEVIENVTDGGKGTRALDVLKGRAMNAEEAIAYDKAVRAFNERGYVLTDTHAGNFTFIDMPDGTKKVGVFDPGGIFPVRGNDPDVARQIQRQIHSPGENASKVGPEWAGAIVSDEVRPSLIQHVDGPSLGVDLEHFVFKPDIGHRNPLLNELAEADDVEEAYRRMRERGN